MNKTQIAHSFGQASRTYEQEAPVQRYCAESLGRRLSDFSQAPSAKGLEIGCGTGFLTQQCLDRCPQVDWLISDLSPDMLAHCASKFEGKAAFEVMDGESIPEGRSFDLIVSNLAFQWFADLEQSLEQLVRQLNPDGCLLFTTLGADTFMEWRNILEGLDLPVGVHDYPSVDDIKTIAPKDCALAVKTEKIQQPYSNGLAFLRALKMIGAHRPVLGYQPLSFKQMKQALAAFDQTQQDITYNILSIEIRKTK